MAHRPMDETRLAEHASMLANRCKKTFAKLHPKMERANIGAFRLYDWDIPEVRAVVDWYEGHIVVAEYEREQTKLVGDWVGTVAAATAEALGVPPEKTHVKRRHTRPQTGKRYERLEKKMDRFPVREGELQFIVNLDDFLDTGLYADHRLTRAMVGKEAAGKRFLNLFCYTGAFTCYAAKGGAASSVSVDASGTYLRWAADNLAHNKLRLPTHDLIHADVRDFLAAYQGPPFDLIVCDPPSFSEGRGRESWDIQRDHPALLQKVLALLTPTGHCYFSTNHQRFEPRLTLFNATELHTVPEDFRNKQAHRLWKLGTGTTFPS